MELVSDWWNCSLADDHYICLRQKELRQLPTYQGRSPQLCLRLHVVDWLAILCDTTGVCMTARHLAVALLDYFMDHHVVEKSHLTLVALCCLHIAAKFEECELNIPKVSELNRLGAPNCPYSAQQYLSMELRLLQFFQWHISLPTAAHFFEYFLVVSVTASDCFDGRSLGDQAESVMSTMSKYVVYFLEVSLQDVSFRSCLPSRVCAACIAAARHCLRISPTWLTRLQHRTGYSWTDLQSLVSLMLEAHERDDRKRSQSPPDPTSSDVHIVTRDRETVSSQVPISHPRSSFISVNSRATSQLAAMDYQLSTAAVIYFVQPQYNVLSIPSYLLAPAWRTTR